MSDVCGAHDRSAHLQAQVQEAQAERRPLEIVGSGSRAGMGLPLGPEAMSVADHCGVIDYQPDELVIRARAGTRLVELEHLLASHGQRFAAEIPAPTAESTLGGAIACGWDGPGRSLGVSLRDTVLGCRLINGHGEIVNFGGQVMKNVAGYDLSRLQVGALGTLGVILDVALRLAPLAERHETRTFAVSPAQLQDWWPRCRELRPLLSGSCWYKGHLHLRFSGRAKALDEVLASLGGEPSDFDWSALRDLRSDFFCAEQLACLLLPPRTQVEIPQGDILTDWEGARIWVKGGDHEELQQRALAEGGFLRVLRGDAVTPVVSAPQWHRRIKDAFDPKGVFNPVLFSSHFESGGEH
ncbi:glycolate oxidase FAD binding subunit [Microbulbifer aggregans]|uniref:Glycolate oxidase FAD binding subunit n=1 Tax=Microbulbifer aggregans TaxID=1769779 RepID=A0A1C9WAP7_9GAMM|nr:glycolate oxidase subunit GlcE [Microbulbifer aggregans]AOS98203.1 glycolate oxidase FAD binding subunit [Microbulbifer aggregans]